MEKGGEEVVTTRKVDMDVELWDVGALSDTVFHLDYVKESALQDVSIVVVVVSLLSVESFVDAKRIVEQFDPIPGARMKSASIPKLIVLTKCDLFMQAALARSDVVHYFEARGANCIAVANCDSGTDVVEMQSAILAAAGVP